ncbi:MAG: hypothetical protein K6L74_16810 [Neptuniibacter sp.]
MDREQLLLAKAAEEAGEIVQEAIIAANNFAKRALKAQQFGIKETSPGWDKDNAERMCLELDDFWASIEMLNEECGLDYEPNRERIEAKKAKVNQYADYSKQLGRVE